MIRIIVHGTSAPFGVVNFDNDTDANAFMQSTPNTRELTEQEISDMFGDFPQYAGDDLTTQTGGTLGSVVFSRTHPVTLLEDTRSAALLDLRANANAALSTLRAGYPGGEVDTWVKQEAEARAWKAWNDGGQSGAEPVTDFIDGMVTGSGDPAAFTKAEIVDRIIANADAAQSREGAIIGQRVSKSDAIKAALTIEDISAVDVSIN